jgi:ABC-type enterobactin transport system permease subunit
MGVAWDGWAVPEILAGAIVGAVLGLTLAAVPPGVSNVIPDMAGVVLGALIGAVLSYVWRPRRITAQSLHALTSEEETVRSRAA